MKPIVYILVLATAALASCAPLRPVDYKGMGNFSVNPSLSTPSASMDLKFFNPNKIGVRVKRVNLALSLDGKQVGTVKNTSKVRVNGNSAFVIPVKAMLTSGDLLSTGMSVLTGRGRAGAVIMEGDIVVTKFIFRKKVHVTYDGKDLKIK